MKNNIWFLALVVCFISACNTTEIPKLETNRLYENLYDDQFVGRVQSITYKEADVRFLFNCEGNLTQVQNGKEKTFKYQYKGDTIVNKITDSQRILYILDKNKRVSQYISEFLKQEEWTTIYRQDWTYDQEGRLVEKNIFSEKAKEKNYFINREKYKYDENAKVEIFKYGIDKANSQNPTGLLRTETRLANEYGSWVLISELDEDGIPYRKSNFKYEYDPQGNWTTVYLIEENNYTGQNNKDTIRRVITYYDSGVCSEK